MSAKYNPRAHTGKLVARMHPSEMLVYSCIAGTAAGAQLVARCFAKSPNKSGSYKARSAYLMEDASLDVHE